MAILNDLGRKHGTDKASGSHNYLVWYEAFVEHLRPLPITILEIGVGDGASLRMWRDHFPLARIIGLDIKEDAKRYHDYRIEIEVGDQETVSDLQRVATRYGPFGLIVDDGGHSEGQQMTSYRELLPHLIPGGVYFLEDIGSQNVIDMLTNLASEVVKQQHPIIESMGFYRETSMTRIKNA